MKFVLILIAFFSFGSTFAANPENDQASTFTKCLKENAKSKDAKSICEKKIAAKPMDKKSDVKVKTKLPSADVTENLDNPVKENSEISGLMQELHTRVVGEDSAAEAESVH